MAPKSIYSMEELNILPTPVQEETQERDRKVQQSLISSNPKVLESTKVAPKSSFSKQELSSCRGKRGRGSNAKRAKMSCVAGVTLKYGSSLSVRTPEAWVKVESGESSDDDCSKGVFQSEDIRLDTKKSINLKKTKISKRKTKDCLDLNMNCMKGCRKLAPKLIKHAELEYPFQQPEIVMNFTPPDWNIEFEGKKKQDGISSCGILFYKVEKLQKVKMQHKRGMRKKNKTPMVPKHCDIRAPFNIRIKPFKTFKKFSFSKNGDKSKNNISNKDIQVKKCFHYK